MDRNRPLSFCECARYCIVVQGRVSAGTAAHLGEMRVAANEPTTSVTVLVGRVRDQAELSGVLNTLYDLHFPILEVELLESAESTTDTSVT